MITKQKILDNVEHYTADQLVEYILQGILTYEEIVAETDGNFEAAKRKIVKQKIESGDSDAWNNAKKTRTLETVQFYLDNYPNGQFRKEARSLKYELEEINNKSNQDINGEKAWNEIDKSSREALQKFINNFPYNSHIDEARNLINQIDLDIIMGVNIDTLISSIKQFQTNKLLTPVQKDENIFLEITNYLTAKNITSEEFLNAIKEDRNLLSSGIVKRLLNNSIITAEDLIGIGIDLPFIQRMLKGDNVVSFKSPEKLEKIHKQSTEIYFWGIPSSGKSCALGAILSVADSGRIAKSMDPDTESQGYGYMTELINLFQNGEICTLMEGTDKESFYEMGFDLLDSDGRIHPITCIDMAGELMRCMYKANAGADLENNDLIMLDTLTKVLIDNRTVSRKMHIFVLEYGAEDRLYEGKPQKVYLDGALAYIKNTGIFKKDTDAIYVMVTKADKIKNATKDNISEYINNKYLGFYNKLEQICKDNEINKGKVEKIAFSLGNVCFQNYCKFNAKPAENVVNLILQRSASYHGGKRGWFEKTFRG